MAKDTIEILGLQESKAKQIISDAVQKAECIVNEANEKKQELFKNFEKEKAQNEKEMNEKAFAEAEKLKAQNSQNSQGDVEKLDKDYSQRKDQAISEIIKIATS